jgi:hypothetical protein
MLPWPSTGCAFCTRRRDHRQFSLYGLYFVLVVRFPLDGIDALKADRVMTVPDFPFTQIDQGADAMKMSFTARFSRLFAVLCMFAFMGLLSGQASAASADSRMFGAWLVKDAPVPENIGLRVFFSPDGNFFMVDPKSGLGYTGSWVVGRVGLLVSIYGNGKWAKLWDADISFKGDDEMSVDVKDSQVTLPQQFTLQKMKF